MSGPSTPTPASANGSGATPQRKNPTNMNSPVAMVMPQWNSFIQQAQAGTMNLGSQKAVRGLLKSHLRPMLYQGFITHKVNIYDNLPAVLDPRVAWNGEPPTLSMEDYARESKIALNEIARLRLQQAAGITASSNTATSPVGISTPSGVNSPSPVGQLRSQVQEASSPSFSSTASSPVPSNQIKSSVPSASSSTTSSAQPGGKTIPPKANTTGPNPSVRPNMNATSVPDANSPVRQMSQSTFTPPRDIMTGEELKRYISIQDVQARNQLIAAEPGLKERYEKSIAFYRARQQPRQPGQTTPARAVRPVGNTLTPTNSGSSTPGAGPSTASTTSQAPPPVNASDPPIGQAASATNPAPQRPPKANTSTSTPNSKVSQAQSNQQPVAVPTARIPPPIRPATPPVNQNVSVTKPLAIAPSPSTGPSPNNNLKSSPAQPPLGDSNIAQQAQSAPGQPDSSSITSQPQSQPPQQLPQGEQIQGQQPQSQPAQQPDVNLIPNLNHIPNPHHNALNYPPPSFNAVNAFAGAPSRPFDLTLPAQRQIPPPQAAPPPPPPVPIEHEADRRKRKLREYLSEDAPGMEIESGVYNVVSEYLDLFLEDSVEAAIRLSKHRKSARVDLKDMALAIEMKHDMRVPGFNVQLPQKTHVPVEGERKRGKAVAPRAARKN